MRKLVLLALSIMLLTTGCTKSNIVSPEPESKLAVNPDLEEKNQVVIDLEDLRDELKEEYIDPFGEYADYVVDLGLIYEDDTKTLVIQLPVLPKTTADVAVEYSTKVLKTCGDIMAVQNFKFEPSSEDSFGTFFDEYNVYVQVFPYISQDDKSAWLVDDVIKAGEQRAPVAKTS